MKFIGITGGVGAGKSEILRYIEREYQAYILLADSRGRPVSDRSESVLRGRTFFRKKAGWIKESWPG